jgi:hypothetical protein
MLQRIQEPYGKGGSDSILTSGLAEHIARRVSKCRHRRAGVASEMLRGPLGIRHVEQIAVIHVAQVF